MRFHKVVIGLGKHLSIRQIINSIEEHNIKLQLLYLNQSDWTTRPRHYH